MDDLKPVPASAVPASIQPSLNTTPPSCHAAAPDGLLLRMPPRRHDTYSMTDTKAEKLAAVEYGLGDLYDDSALLRRIDWRILPIMFLTYFLQFLDKVALNVSPPLPPTQMPTQTCQLTASVRQCDGNARRSRDAGQ